MLQRGALGYLSKCSPVEELFTAIETIAGGEKFICQKVADLMAAQVLLKREHKSDSNSLSQREFEVIEFIRKGLSSKEIAVQLQLSAKTVEVHRYHILHKLGLKNSASLVSFINQNAAFV